MDMLPAPNPSIKYPLLSWIYLSLGGTADLEVVANWINTASVPG